MLRKKPEDGESKHDRKRRELASAIWNEARIAKEQGRTIFSFSYQIGSDSSIFSFIHRTSESSPDELLTEVERLGWRLEHVDHVHVARSSTSTDAEGVTVGHYYFRSH